MTASAPDKGTPTEIAGHRYWLVNGRLRPFVSGASDPPPDPPPDPDPPGPPPDPEVDHEAEAAKWRSLARKHEERAKANAKAQKELDDLKAASATEQDRAVLAAKAEGRSEALSSVGTKLVDAELRAAAAGRLDDKQRDALIEGLDRSRFLNDDGDVDTDKVKALIEGIAGPKSDKDTKPPFPNLGQGRRPVGDPTPSVASGRDLFEERKGTKK